MTFDHRTRASPCHGRQRRDGLPSPRSRACGSYFPGWSTRRPLPLDTATRSAARARPRHAASARATRPRRRGRGAWSASPSTSDLTAQEQEQRRDREVSWRRAPTAPRRSPACSPDAKYYLWSDPNGPQQTDSYVQGMLPERVHHLAHRRRAEPRHSAVLLGDGRLRRPARAPSRSRSDRRPPQLCGNGQSTVGQASVETFVIGFAVSTVRRRDARPRTARSSPRTAPTRASATATSPNLPALTVATRRACGRPSALAARCSASRSSAAATTPTSPTPRATCRSALGAILASIAQNTTTRTTPAYSPAITNSSRARAARRRTTVGVSRVVQPVAGATLVGRRAAAALRLHLLRLGLHRHPAVIQIPHGDDFADEPELGHRDPRQFIAFQPAANPITGVVDSTTTIRPYVAVTGGDGIGQLLGHEVRGCGGGGRSPQHHAQALGIPTSAKPAPTSSTVNGAQKCAHAAQCATMLLDFTSRSRPSTAPHDFSFVSRCGNALGDIFHANPDRRRAARARCCRTRLHRLRLGYACDGRRPAATSSTPRPTTACCTPSGRTRRSSRTTRCGRCSCRRVMPNLLVGSYPSSHEFLARRLARREGRRLGSRRSRTRRDPTAWHTMLVAGYGPQLAGLLRGGRDQPESRPG